jgi:hypothetical protein
MSENDYYSNDAQFYKDGHFNKGTHGSWIDARSTFQDAVENLSHDGHSHASELKEPL